MDTAVSENAMGDSITCNLNTFSALYANINIVVLDISDIVTTTGIGGYVVVFDPATQLPYNNGGLSSTPTCDMTTTNANDVLIGWVATNTTTVGGIPDGFTSAYSSNSGTPYIESDYAIVSSTQPTVEETWGLGSPDYWGSWCDALEINSSPTTVVQPMVCGMEDSPPYIVNATLSDSDSSLNSTSLYCDGNTNYYSVDANAMVTISLPAPNSTQEYAFNDTTDTQTFTACASDTCSPVTYYVYYLVNNTYQVTAKAASAFDVGLSVTFDDYTLDIPVCSIASTTATATNSCSGFSSYGNPVTAEQYLGNSGSHIQWQNTAGSSSTVATPTTYGNTYNVNYYKQVTNTFKVTANAQTDFDAGMSWAVTGTYLGGSSTICTISSTAATSDTCTAYSDYNSAAVIPQAASSPPSNSRWYSSAACSHTPTTGGNTYTCASYKQLYNTYQMTPSTPNTWNAGTTETVTGTLFGTGSQTVCTVTLTNGGGAASCIDYADYDTTVTLPASFILSGTIWDASGSHTFTQTTGGNTNNVNYDGPGTISITLTTANSGPSDNFTVSTTGSGCSVSPSTVASDGSSHDITTSQSCVITVTVPSDGATARYRFSDAGAAVTTWVFTATLGDSYTNTTYYQLENTYEATPLSPDTWNANGMFTVKGTFVGTSSSTICTIDVSSGGGEESCESWADYDKAVTVESPVNLSGTTWTETGGNTFTQTTGGNTNDVDYNGVSAVTFSIVLTTADSAAAGTFGVSGCSVSRDTVVSNDSAQIFTSAGSCAVTVTQPSPSGGDRYVFSDRGTAVTTWTFETCSSGECSAYENTTYYQYDITMTIHAEATTDFDSGLSVSFIGTSLGNAGATICSLSPITTGSSDDCSGYVDYHKTVTFPQYLTGSGSNIEWQNGAGDSSTCEATSGDQNCSTVDYYKQLSNTYTMTPDGPSSWTGTTTKELTGTYLGSSSTTLCTFSLTPTSGAVSCTRLADYDTQVNLVSNFPLGGALWENIPPASESFTQTTGGNTNNVNYLVYSALSITLDVQNGGPTDHTVGVSESTTCYVTPSTIDADNEPHVVNATYGCTNVEIVAPAAAGNARFLFNIDGTGSQTWVVPVCSAITCSDSHDIYYQFDVTLNAYSNVGWTGVGNFTETGDFVGNEGSTICSFLTIVYHNEESCTGWTDFNEPVLYPQYVRMNGTLWAGTLFTTGDNITSSNLYLLGQAQPTMSFDDSEDLVYTAYYFINQGAETPEIVGTYQCTGTDTGVATISGDGPWQITYKGSTVHTCTYPNPITVGQIVLSYGIIWENNTQDETETHYGCVTGDDQDCVLSSFYEPSVNMRGAEVLGCECGFQATTTGRLTYSFKIQVGGTVDLNLAVQVTTHWNITVMVLQGYAPINSFLGTDPADAASGYGCPALTISGSDEFTCPAYHEVYNYIAPGSFQLIGAGANVTRPTYTLKAALPSSGTLYNTTTFDNCSPDGNCAAVLITAYNTNTTGGFFQPTHSSSSAIDLLGMDVGQVYSYFDPIYWIGPHNGTLVYVTIESDPLNLKNVLTVNDTTYYENPDTLAVLKGSSLGLTAAATALEGNLTLLDFSHWSQGGDRTQVYDASANATLIAYYGASSALACAGTNLNSLLNNGCIWGAGFYFWFNIFGPWILAFFEFIPSLAIYVRTESPAAAVAVYVVLYIVITGGLTATVLPASLSTVAPGLLGCVIAGSIFQLLRSQKGG